MKGVTQNLTASMGRWERGEKGEKVRIERKKRGRGTRRRRKAVESESGGIDN